MAADLYKAAVAATDGDSSTAIASAAGEGQRGRQDGWHSCSASKIMPSSRGGYVTTAGWLGDNN